MAEAFDDRLTLLERMAEQQLRLNDQLLTLTARLGEEHALYAERQAQHEAILLHLAQSQEAATQRHEAQMAQLRDILQAIKDMLPRGNGHG